MNHQDPQEPPPTTSEHQKVRVVVRELRLEDHSQVQEIHRSCYTQDAAWSEAHFVSQLQTFPQGQICVEIDGQVVAVAGALIVDIEALPKKHTYDEVCGGGYIREHDPEGDTLYGIDIAVHPDFRGQRFARRLYDERKEIVQRLGLRGIVFGGRMPLYQKYRSQISPQEYVRRVIRKQINDPVIVAQMANGFVVRSVIENYLPADKESVGNAVLMEWRNPYYVPSEERTPTHMRVAAVQYQMRSVSNFDDFATQCEFFVDTAADYKADFLLFPELLTNQLLALVPSETPAHAARNLASYTEEYERLFCEMAIRYNINIIAGTHLVMQEERLYNVAYLFHRDGRVDTQRKVHITPAEAKWWGVAAGSEVQVFQTDRGKIAIPICYDIEFPELARIAKNKGADVLFVPYNTDIRSGHIRVRSCAAARAIENHMFVVMAGAVGNLPKVEGADIHYGQAAVLTPSDVAFARDGVAAEGTPNAETMIVHDLDLALRKRTESTGTVRTWKDRRNDLYEIIYKG